MASGGVRSRRRARTLALGSFLLVVSSSALVLVLASPLALPALDDAGRRDWRRLSEIGQTYGAVSALLSALALGGIAVSLFAQNRSMKLDLEHARRTVHIELIRMALDDPDLMDCYGFRVATSERHRRQNLYCNQIMSTLEMNFETGAIDEEHVRANLVEMFGSAASRRWWSEVRGVREATTRRRRRVRELVDEEWALAMQRSEAEGDDRPATRSPSEKHRFLSTLHRASNTLANVNIAEGGQLVSRASPTALRRWFAFDLKRMRLEAGLSQLEVAKVLGCGVSKISLIENGQRPVRRSDIEKLLVLYGVPEEQQDQYLRGAARAREKGWWERDVLETLPEWLRVFVGLEQGAVTQRSFQPAIVHGLLQTPAYTVALLRQNPNPTSDEMIERLAGIRRRRQEVLTREDDPLEMESILDEAALRRVVGDHRVMHEQMQRLLDLSERPNIVIRVVPFTSPAAYVAAYGAFTIFKFPWATDPGLVYIEHRSGAVMLDALSDIDAHSVLFTQLRELTLSVDDSAQLVRDYMMGYSGD